MKKEITLKSDLRERDGHLINNWYIACLSRELKLNRPLQRIIYDEPLVFFRNEKGTAVCLPDRCLHRHAQLSEGKIENGCLRCPYHGWSYGADGSVKDIPSEGPIGKKNYKSLRLPARVVVEQDGCIWVWMGNRAPRTALPPFRFPHMNEKKWAWYFMVTDFDNEVTHLAENFMDVPHTVFIHSGWFRNPSSKEVPIQVDVSNGEVLVTYDQPLDKIGFTQRILNPNNEPMIHTDRFILPNLTRVDYHFGHHRSFLIISQCTPVGSLKCRVYTYIVYRLGAFLNLMKPFMNLYTRKVIQQDVDIMLNQGANFKRDMNLNFHGTQADIVHVSIEKLREHACNGNPLAYSHRDTQRRNIWI